MTGGFSGSDAFGARGSLRCSPTCLQAAITYHFILFWAQTCSRLTLWRLALNCQVIWLRDACYCMTCEVVLYQVDCISGPYALHLVIAVTVVWILACRGCRGIMLRARDAAHWHAFRLQYCMDIRRMSLGFSRNTKAQLDATWCDTSEYDE
jgi:hypothetical protein